VRVKIDQGMASGMPFTAVGNSCVNSIYLRVGWLMLAEKFAPSYCDMKKFDANVKCAVYGDDNVVTVKAQVADWYNLRNIALCLEPFGILMTDGQKNPRAQTQPFSSWDKIRFLKRAFVLDPSTRLYLAPLDRKTILDRIRYTKAKKWLPDMLMRIEMSLMDAIFHGPEYFAALKYFVNSALEELHLPTVNVCFKNERARWEAQSLLLEMQGPGELTFAEQGPDGNVRVYYARDNEAPTRIATSYYLKVNGPRLAIGEETNPQGIWKPFRNAPTTPPTTSTGGVTLAQLQDELNARPCVTVQQIRDEIARIPQRTGLTLAELRRELDARPTGSGGLTLAELQRELAAQPSANTLTLAQLQSELTRLPQAGGITLTQLRQELDARPSRQCLTLSDLVRELDMRPCRAISTPFPTPGPIAPPPMVVPFQPTPSGSFIANNGMMVEQTGPLVPRFKVRFPAQPGDEAGNYPTAHTLRTQKDELLARNPGKYTKVEIRGRDFYRCSRSPAPEWSWTMIHWNLVQILLELGARDPIFGTAAHGRWEWGTMSDNVLNIASALFEDTDFKFEQPGRNRREIP